MQTYDARVSVTVHPAVPDDASELAEVAAVTWPLASPPSVPPEAIARFVEAHLSTERFEEYVAADDRRVLVARDGDGDGPIVGWAMLNLGEPADPDVAATIRIRPTAELSKIYVLPELHGGGVARLLMEASVTAAREAGAAGLWLGTNQQNVRAQRFYDKSGFTRVGTKQFDVGGKVEDDFVYEIAL